MQVIPVNPPKIFARNPAGRMVQIAGHAGDIGKFDNVVVPDGREIQHLRPVVRYMEKLKPKPFEYGSTTGYSKYPQRSGRETAPTITFNTVDDLPLFEKQTD